MGFEIFNEVKEVYMKFNKLLVAAAVAAASAASYAAPGDVVFTSDPFGSSAGPSAIIGSDFSFSDLAVEAGMTYMWEVGVQTTGGMSLTGVTFNGMALTDVVGPKYTHGFGMFTGPDMLVHVDGATGQAGSFSGTLTVTQVVPEPGTYAMLLAGLGAVGFVARRRKLM